MKKGFTLIELLAVIVILAVIALIATPIVLNVIDDIKISSLKISMSNMEKSLDLYYFQNKKSGNITFECNNKKCVDDNGSNLVINGNLPESGKINISKDGKITYDSIVIDGYLCDKYNVNFVCNKVNGKMLEINKKFLTLEDNNSTFLNNYKIYGNSVQLNFPLGYQQVEYIEADSGHKYIDTGIVPNQDTGFDIVFLTKNELNYNNYGSILGVRKSGMVDELQISTYSPNSSYKGIFRFGNIELNAGIEANQLMHITLKDKVYTNNNGISYTLTKTFTSPGTLTIFALNQNSSVIQYGKMQLYSLKIYDGLKLVRNFIPCYHKINQAVGLFDMVEKKFYENPLGSKFIYGNDVASKDMGVDNPLEIKNVGNLIIDSSDPNHGKYEIRIKVAGKNLFNVSTVDDYFGSPLVDFTINGNILSAKHTSGNSTTMYNQTKHNSGNYVLTADFSGIKRHLIRCFSEDGSLLTGSDITIENWTYNKSYQAWYSKALNSVSVSIPEEVDYWQYGVGFHGKTVGEPETVSNIQIEKGNTATSYEPYYEKIYSIYLDKPLRKLDDYVDYIDYKNQKLIRNVGVLNLNSEDNFELKDNYFTLKLEKYPKKDQELSISNYLEYEKSFWFEKDTLNIKIEGINSVNELKEWLRDKNVEIYYPLNKSVVSDIELPKININNDYSNMIIETGIKPSNMLIEYD